MRSTEDTMRSIALFAVLATAMLAHAAPGPSSCREITDDTLRLNCYDEIVDSMPRPDAGTPTGPVPSDAAKGRSDTDSAGKTATTAPALAISGETIFGKVGSTDTAVIHTLFGVPDLDFIESTIAQSRKSAEGRRVLVLTNGHIWAQLDNANLQLSVGDVVRIRRGAVGSFLLSCNATKKSMRVKRID